MLYTKYIFFTFILLSFLACNSTKEPKKVEKIKEKIKAKIKENNSSLPSTVETLSLKQIVLKQSLDSYLKDLSTFNIDAVVEQTYPKLFYVIDPNLFKNYITSMMNSKDIAITSYKTNITKLSEITTFSNETQFAQAKYTSTINIRFLNNELYHNKEKMNFLYDALIHKYGKKNININPNTRTLQIKKPEQLLIIKEKDSEWKFLANNSKYRRFYPDFLPYEILEFLNQKGELH